MQRFRRASNYTWDRWFSKTLIVWPTHQYCHRGISRLPFLNSDLLCTSIAKSRTLIVWSLFSLYRKQRKLPPWGQKQNMICSCVVSHSWSVPQQLRITIPCSANSHTFSLASLMFLSFINSMHRLLIFFCTSSSDSLLEINVKPLNVTPSYNSSDKLLKVLPSHPQHWCLPTLEMGVHRSGSVFRQKSMRSQTRHTLSAQGM